MQTVKTLLDSKLHMGVWVIHPNHSVYEALEQMAEKNVGALPVIDHGQLVGIFSERDYARKIILQGKESKNTSVAQVMSTLMYTVALEDDIQSCMKLMRDKRIRHLPVIEKGQLIGILSIGDIVNAIIEEQENHIKNLEQYITGT